MRQGLSVQGRPWKRDTAPLKPLCGVGVVCNQTGVVEKGIALLKKYFREVPIYLLRTGFPCFSCFLFRTLFLFYLIECIGIILFFKREDRGAVISFQYICTE